ncbi:MAG: S-layer homology domain-containing protein [Candidatus Fermentithermobacillus carboniphilus]|uniref:S-layer homology domain-containing protein n=1 Tax=Candidatus Fermentithermobacillus carboniphilus TaxID=3085328 RepID=A0AAT9LAV5_9FIRM|nr:MAG: S-layer homology domain-containing protein [Candidatus Fermentithermobacillus carboniphilus]
MKRVVSACVIAWVVLRAPGISRAQELSGRAVEIRSHWAGTVITEAIARGLVRGYPDGSLRVDRHVTRGEFAVLICRGIVAEEVSDWAKRVLPPFPDIRDHWAVSYITALAEMNVLRGDGGKVRPDERITRAEAMTSLDRIIEAFAGSLSNETGAMPFADAASVPDWAEESVRRLVKLGVVIGDDKGYLRPLDDVTRAEAVTLILRTMEVLGKRWDLEGTIAGVDPLSREMWITSSGETVRLRWLSDTINVYSGGKSVGLGSVRFGCRVKVVLDGSKKTIGMIIIDK